MTEQQPARRSTTRASPSFSASLRPPVVTRIKTALSPTGLIVGLSGTVQPHGRRQKCDAAQEQAADHVRTPRHVKGQAVEGHENDDRDGHWHGKETDGGRWSKPPDHK